MTPTNTSIPQPASWELEWRLIEVMCDCLNLDSHQLRPEDPFLDVVGIADSLDIIELVMRLEEEFQVSLPDEWWQNVFTRTRTITIREMALVIEQRRATAPLPPRKPQPATVPVPERAPFLQLGGWASEWDWLNGPLYQPLGTNRNGRMECRRGTDGMRCIELPAANVTPSSSDETRPERVAVSSFLADAEPVSNRAFARFLNSIGTVPANILLEWCGTTRDDHCGAHFGLKQGGWWVSRTWWSPLFGTERQPMILVSWYGAAAYSLWAHRFDWRYYRGDGIIPSELSAMRVNAPPPPAGDLCLPSELEWEYAARGPEPQRYPWGDAEPAPELLWFGQHQRGQHYTADSLPAADVCARLGMSPFGLHHVAGNVWQWCRDWYRPGSTPRSRTEPTGIRSERGGSWVGPARLAECGYRRGRPPLARGRCLGFRCVGTGERFP